MSYQVFQNRVNNLARRAGGNIKVSFSADADSGRYMAVCHGMCKILGNSSCKRVEVRWGSGHKALAVI